ncbi:MAG: protease modulator HflC [Planctomycetota bacterium]|nr:MAG: protease modulator HflC [Planctomycetota bacterium]
MKTAIPLIVLLLVVMAALVFYSCAYQVEEGKQVIVTQFGKPVAEVESAGLHFKQPFVQEVSYLEKRLLPWDGAPESLQTKDKKRIGVDVWARWRIVEPMMFFVKVRTEQRGQKILDDLVDSTVRDVVARHNLIDVVRKSNDELIYETRELDRAPADKVVGNGRDDVEEEILRGVDLKEYGMELVKVRIKRVNYVASVREAVYERMISERLRIAKLFDSEAQEEKNRILGQTRKELDRIEGEMEQKSAEVRGEADAKVIQLTADAYSRSPEFYEFLRRLEVFKKTLSGDTRLILSTEGDLFRMLKEPGEPASAPAALSGTSP